MSWVDVVSIERGDRRACISAHQWTVSGGTEKIDGSCPTSLWASSRTDRYSAVSSTPFAITGPLSCWNRIVNSTAPALMLSRVSVSSMNSSRAASTSGWFAAAVVTASRMMWRSEAVRSGDPSSCTRT